ncbi:transmembrane GTPase Marf-like isoform X2 [Dermatophagoides farinae]|uniref:transmembrane GTPase Marf-like isoform X2 n=1 Tax=Dermatophagoides farinae TaxID=6954 RepID=UPI003F62F7A5
MNKPKSNELEKNIHFLWLHTSTNNNNNNIMTLDFNSTGDDNPLRIFVSAKKDINDLFIKAEKFVKNVDQFYRSYDESMFEQNNINFIENSIEKISGIRDVLARNNMKVAFFGRTSNGKSTVINAILQNKILPAGIGHTTNCFLQVEGTDETEPYIVLEDQRHNIESVKHLANALNTESLGDSTLVKVYWPKSKCSILHDDVVLVDSPGTDVTANLDKWIDLYCLDADVFVLVSNAESTLMQTEKNFFIKVKEKLSKPNIFILNNRWDASAHELDSLDLVRKQHLKRDKDFLVNDMGVLDENNAQNHVFFVSAIEVLRARLELEEGKQINISNYAHGFESRFREFIDFEKKFEQCLSKSAVQTKFGQHTLEVIKMTDDFNQFLMEISTKTIDVRNEKRNQIKIMKERVQKIKQQFQIFTNEVKLQICNLVKQVEQKVSTALNDEIRRLSTLVNDFDRPFNTDEISLNLYKKELHTHVEQGLGSNLKSRLSSALSCNVEATQRQMIDGVKRFISEMNFDQLLLNQVSSQQDFKLIYRINCESLCSDFQEDLEFRFSYGFFQLVRVLTGAGGGGGGSSNGMNGSKNEMDKSNLSLSQKPSNSLSHNQSLIRTTTDHLDLLDKLASSRSTIIVLAVGGSLIRVIGWHVIAITSAIYVLLYVYERFSWTTRAKENAFKKQYVAHATKKLRLIIDLTSANCSHQVQQELSSTFARLNRMVDQFVEQMQKEIQKLEQEVQLLNHQEQMIAVLKNEVRTLTSELQNFSEKYL